MFAPARLSAALLVLAPLACGDDRGASGTDASTSITTVPPTTDPPPTTTVEPTTAAASTTTTSDSGTAGIGASETGTSSSGGTTVGVKFDVGAQLDVPGGCGGRGGGMPEFSYIWVANSAEGTISKIDTQTLEEKGRYVVRPDSAGSPSRTSVNLSGDVAVANRLGGVTKVYADPKDCQDTNGTPGIQTATDSNFLPWGVEECVAWYAPFDYSTQRPVAWAPGVLDPGTCEYTDEKLWTAGGQNDVVNSLVVNRLHGDSGAVEATIPMPDVPIGYFGAYGGAVNQEGDFWFVIYDTFPGPSHLVHVDAVSLQYEKFPVPAGICPYGFTVDSQGRPWIGSFCQASVRFDPMTQAWDQFPVLGYGIQQDAKGRMWIADYQLPGVREIDSDTLALGKAITLPSFSVKGVSIDFYGYVWVVDMDKSAFRVDPDTDAFLSYDGLVGPYTYSDMTGWGLSNVTFPQG